jgi:hypothetical protein
MTVRDTTKGENYIFKSAIIQIILRSTDHPYQGKLKGVNSIPGTRSEPSYFKSLALIAIETRCTLRVRSSQ